MEARKSTVPERINGTGFFNRSTEPSAFVRAINEAHSAPYTTVDADGRKSVQITGNDYAETFNKAWEGKRPDLSDKNQDRNPMWTAPYMERTSMQATVSSSRMYTMDAYRQAQEQADTFGMESLAPGEQDALKAGPEKFAAALEFMGQIGEVKDGAPCYGVKDELHDTGRYVILETPDGSERSGYLMELPPLNGTHRFLDLECPEGTAQILSLEEGAYNVHSEWSDSPLIQAGIEAAQKVKEEYQVIPTHYCGEEHEAVKSADRQVGDGDGGSAPPAPPAAGDGSAYAALMREKDRADSRDVGLQAEDAGPDR